MKYKIIIPPFVEATIRELPPALKKKIRAALEEIAEDPYIGKLLKDELRGLRSFRVARFRIVYRIHHSKIQVQIIDLGPRNIIYERVVNAL